MFLMRFDLRAPGPTPPRLTSTPAALDMAEWAEDKGLSRRCHLRAPRVRGRLPALAAGDGRRRGGRTSNVGISIAALLLLMYDPIKLAEDLNVLDHLSRGRVLPGSSGSGSRPRRKFLEPCFGIDPRPRRRGDGETARGAAGRLGGRGTVTLAGPCRGRFGPCPTPKGAGEGWRTAAGFACPRRPRRAHARPSTSIGEAEPTGKNLAAEVLTGPRPSRSRPPAGRLHDPVGGITPAQVFIAEDMDAAWAERVRAPTCSPRRRGATRSVAGSTTTVAGRSTLSRATTVEELDAEDGTTASWTPGQAVELVRTRRGYLGLGSPCAAGLAPDAAWRSLRADRDRRPPSPLTRRETRAPSRTGVLRFGEAPLCRQEERPLQSVTIACARKARLTTRGTFT